MTDSSPAPRGLLSELVAMVPDAEWWTRERPGLLSGVLPSQAWSPEQLAALRTLREQGAAMTRYPGALGMTLDLAHSIEGTPIHRAALATSNGLDQLGRSLGFAVPTQAPVSVSDLEGRLAGLERTLGTAFGRLVPQSAEDWLRGVINPAPARSLP